MDDPRLLAVRRIGAFFTGDASVKTSIHHGRDESEILFRVTVQDAGKANALASLLRLSYVFEALSVTVEVFDNNGKKHEPTKIITQEDLFAAAKGAFFRNNYIKKVIKAAEVTENEFPCPDPWVVVICDKRLLQYFNGDMPGVANDMYGNENLSISEVLGEILLPQPEDIRKVRLVATTLFQRDFNDSESQA